eukprot:jgi/Mesen1/397/ME000010S_10858
METSVRVFDAEPLRSLLDCCTLLSAEAEADLSSRAKADSLSTEEALMKRAKRQSALRISLNSMLMCTTPSSSVLHLRPQRQLHVERAPDLHFVHIHQIVGALQPGGGPRHLDLIGGLHPVPLARQLDGPAVNLDTGHPASYCQLAPSLAANRMVWWPQRMPTWRIQAPGKHTGRIGCSLQEEKTRPD